MKRLLDLGRLISLARMDAWTGGGSVGRSRPREATPALRTEPAA